jgi:molybdate/tungstate transport system substrate-binding protein
VKPIAAKMALILVGLALTATIFGCGSQTETLRISHAGSLAVPFADLKAEFEELHPNVDVVLESGGSAEIISRAIAQEQAGESPPEIIASADYKLIPDRLYADGYADWYIAFARNKMVLCYRDGAPGSEEIESGERTWYDVLRNGAVSYGHSDPDADPCGYRTLLVTQLAQKYYHDEAAEFGLTPDSNADGLYDALFPGTEHERGRTGGTSEARPGGSEEIVSKKSVDLIVALQTGDLDYAFEYRSVAVQHQVDFIELDDHINLSKTNAELPGVEDFYNQASIEIISDVGPPLTYDAKKGGAIVYGITIPLHAQNEGLAADFIDLLLSETGKEIMEMKYGQPFIEPVICDHPENLPDGLKDVL